MLFWRGKLLIAPVLLGFGHMSAAAKAHGSAPTKNRASLAIIDSGVDNEHPELTQNIWRNPRETIGNGKDDDGNGYIDDVFGWNFAESNALVIDRSYLGSFTDAPYRFFELQAKLLLGDILPEELDEMKAIASDPQNQKELRLFGNFVHGTHVAGIASSMGPSDVVALKIIPTQIKPPLLSMLKRIRAQASQPDAPRTQLKPIETAIKGVLFLLARAQGLVMTDVARYLHRQKISVANGSFGVSAQSAETVIVPLLRIALSRPPTQDETQEYCNYFVQQVVAAQSVLADVAKDTLLVFAAGNDGQNNDARPTSPANIKRGNTLSVAATQGITSLAPFSNYGSAMVDIAAPGVAIRSASPGGEHLTLSGTSQAAPYVAGVAAQIRGINPRLSPEETRSILLSTVEPLAFLKGRVASGGVVHPDRALAAAQLSVNHSVDAAVELAFVAWPKNNLGQSALWSVETSSQWPKDTYVLPLPTLFQGP
jgi:cell wall-associated protease